MSAVSSKHFTNASCERDFKFNSMNLLRVSCVALNFPPCTAPYTHSFIFSVLISLFFFLKHCSRFLLIELSKANWPPHEVSVFGSPANTILVRNFVVKVWAECALHQNLIGVLENYRILVESAERCPRARL